MLNGRKLAAGEKCVDVQSTEKRYLTTYNARSYIYIFIFSQNQNKFGCFDAAVLFLVLAFFKELI